MQLSKKSFELLPVLLDCVPVLNSAVSCRSQTFRDRYALLENDTICAYHCVLTHIQVSVSVVAGAAKLDSEREVIDHTSKQQHDHYLSPHKG